MPTLKELVRPSRSSQAALSATIASYDAEAEAYAARFDSVDLSNHLDGLLGMITSLRGGIVDLGCGPGRDLGQLSARGIRATGVDISSGMLRLAQQAAPKAAVAAGDLRWLPFRDCVFAGGWACASLLHLNFQDALLALHEAHRVIKPGGALFLSVVAGVGDEWRVDAAGGLKWFQYYKREKVERLLTLAGFDVVSAEVANGVRHGNWVNAFAVRR